MLLLFVVLCQGEAVEDVLEELSAEHKFEALRRDARVVACATQAKVFPRGLAPTEGVAGHFVPGLSRLNCVRPSKKGTWVCPSGASVWFEEKHLLTPSQPRPPEDEEAELEGKPLQVRVCECSGLCSFLCMSFCVLLSLCLVHWSFLLLPTM